LATSFKVGPAVVWPEPVLLEAFRWRKQLVQEILADFAYGKYRRAHSQFKNVIAGQQLLRSGSCGNRQQ
jgi:hypothetical protein